MSSVSDEPLPYLDVEEVADLLKNEKKTTVVIDVRDIDFLRYKIPNSLHIPADEIFENVNIISDTISKLSPKPKKVIFYCNYRFVL
jgi:rhodanese-related sulfurtransferase